MNGPGGKLLNGNVGAAPAGEASGSAWPNGAETAAGTTGGRSNAGVVGAGRVGGVRGSALPPAAGNAAGGVSGTLSKMLSAIVAL